MQGAKAVRPSLRVLLVSLAAMLLTASSVGLAGAAANNVELCHKPGTPAEETLNVSESTVGAHINHGDVLRSCDDLSPPRVLGEVQGRGTLNCGVSLGGAVGFSEFDDGTDTWSGLDVDLCMAVAAAVLGDATAVNFVPLSAFDRFPAVRDGTVDVLIRTTTDTLSRDAQADNGGAGLSFGPTYFYDGAGILAYTVGLGGCETDPDGCGFDDLAGLAVCVFAGTSTEGALLDLQAELMPGVIFDVVSDEDALTLFFDGHCDAFTSDQSALLRIQTLLGEDSVIFNDTFTKQPLAPAVRDGDDEWMAVVRWAFNAAFLAEELGIDQSNVDAERNSSTDASRAFGDDAALTGERLGLGPNWGYNIIKQVGNYAEMYDRNLTTPLGLARNRNASYLDGGLIYAPPIR